MSNRKLISEGTGWEILLLGLGILVVGIVFGVVLPVVGILPGIHFKAAEQDPKQGILVICQLIFMIVWKLRFICVFCFTGYTEKRRG